MPGLTTLTQREGVAGIALLAMFSDGIIAPEEDEVLRAHLATYPPFDSIPDHQLGEMLARLEAIATQNGEKALLEMSCGALTTEHAELAFLVAADIIAADGEVVLAESDFLTDLQKRLKLAPAQVERIFSEVESRR